MAIDEKIGDGTEKIEIYGGAYEHPVKSGPETLAKYEKLQEESKN